MKRLTVIALIIMITVICMGCSSLKFKPGIDSDLQALALVMTSEGLGEQYAKENKEHPRRIRKAKEYCKQFLATGNESGFKSLIEMAILNFNKKISKNPSTLKKLNNLAEQFTVETGKDFDIFLAKEIVKAFIIGLETETG